MFCYNKQIVMRVIGQMPPLLTWHIFQIVVDCLSPIVFAYVLNQSHGHWFFSDALHSPISMSKTKLFLNLKA